MAVDVERLVAEQRQAIAGFFNTEIPAPSDRLFEVAEINRQEKLFDDPIILYALRRSFPEGVTFPGQRVPMGPVLYRYMSENLVDADANCLPGAWIMFDSTQRPDYDKGRQMYPDTTRFRQVLASVRAEHPEISEHSYHIPPDSRFYFASGEIDGRGWEYITTKVANILKLQP
ncbi:hypothetical protein HYU94_00495 [Candidatus Daviesbacteria bacterium]|nr:hypothetical protein [Candidatus Daviesbacteria bacterium]